jgi:hypothetical protein
VTDPNPPRQHRAMGRPGHGPVRSGAEAALTFPKNRGAGVTAVEARPAPPRGVPPRRRMVTPPGGRPTAATMPAFSSGRAGGTGVVRAEVAR